MSDKRLTDLSVGSAIGDSDLFYSVQASSDVQQPASALASYALGKTSVFFVTAATDAAIRAARSAAISAGGGVIYLPNANITLSSPIPCDSGIHWIGVPPQLSFSTNIPDSVWTLTGGSILTGNGTFSAFAGNNIDNASPPSPFAASAINDFKVESIGFNNFKHAIEIGAKYQIGCVYSQFKNLYITNGPDFGLYVQNFMHCIFEQIIEYNQYHAGYFSCYNDSTVLATGNSYFNRLHAINVDALSRGWVFEAKSPDGVAKSQLGDCAITQLQYNRYNGTTISQSATFVNTSTNVTVTDGTKFAVGLPVTFTSSGNGFIANQIYVVLSVSGNVLTLGNSKNGSAIAANNNLGLTIISYGMPNVEIQGINGGSSEILGFNNLTLDIGGLSGATVWLENAINSHIHLQTDGIPANVNTAVCVRNSQASEIWSQTSTKIDMDANSSGVRFFGGRDYCAEYSGVGLYNDSVRGTYGLTIGTFLSGNTFDVEARSPNGPYLYPISPMGQKVTYWDSSLTLTTGQAGIVVFNGPSGQKFTLPTIVTDTNPIISHIGCPFFIVNKSPYVLVVSTSGGQAFLDGSTSKRIRPGSFLFTYAAQNSLSTMFWQANEDPRVANISANLSLHHNLGGL